MPETNQKSERGGARRDKILDAAIQVFGRQGYRKTAVDELAAAAGISKPGLYLHFRSKEAIAEAAFERYFSEGLALVDAALKKPGVSLAQRLQGALDAWFGRHLATFAPESRELIESGGNLGAERVEAFQEQARARVAKAIGDAPEFKKARNAGSPKEVAQALFWCGLSWKDGEQSRAELNKKLATAVRVCCQL